MTLKEQSDQFLIDDNVLYIYESESAINKQYMVDSDSTYLVVVKEEFDNTNFDANIMMCTISTWFKIIENGGMAAFECAALKPKYVIKEYVSLTPKLNILNLRNEVECICNAAKNTLEWEFSNNNAARGKQTLYSVFKYVLYGIQIMINKKIINLEIPDSYYIDIILNPNNEYKYYEENYLNKLNDLLNEFKSYSENEYQEYKRKQIIENGRK